MIKRQFTFLKKLPSLRQSYFCSKCLPADSTRIRPKSIAAMRYLWIILMTAVSMGAAAQQPIGKVADKGKFSLKKIENMPANFFLTQLQNGLEVLVVEDPAVPLATIELVVKNGAFVQTDDLNGLAHLYEHMFFKANRDYPSQEQYLERVNELGIVFNGTTSNERVNYFITLSSKKLEEGLQFMNSASRFPLFIEEEMKKENVVVAGEFQRAESNPVFYLLKDGDERLWGDLMPRKNAIGSYEVILSATPEIMKDIKNRYYHPDNSMLVVAGDVRHDDVFNDVNRIYGDWARSTSNVFEKYPIPDFKPLSQSSSYITVSDIAQVPIYLRSWHGPDTRNDRAATYAADVMSFILSQRSSKLQQALVESGLAYQVSVGYSTQKYVGPIQVFMVPNPAQTEKALQVLQEQLDMMDDPNYFTDEQLTTAKEMLEIQDIYGKEKTSDYVHTVTYWWSTADLGYFTTYIPKLKAVTRADIQRYVQTYIKGKPSVQGILVSPNLRQMMQLDSYYMSTADISTYNIPVNDDKQRLLDPAAAITLRTIAYMARLEGKPVIATYTTRKTKEAESVQRQFEQLLKTENIKPSEVQFRTVVDKNSTLSFDRVRFAFLSPATK